MDNINLLQTKTKQRKKRLNKEQVKLLESSFMTNKKLPPELKLDLADQLDVPPRQVAVWYQNKRARWKSQRLELDNCELQMKLEIALNEKKKLEKDVEKLKGELEKTQRMNMDNFFTPFDLYNYEEEEGSSSKLSFERGVDEELYSCLMGDGKNESIWD